MNHLMFRPTDASYRAHEMSSACWCQPVIEIVPAKAPAPKPDPRLKNFLRWVSQGRLATEDVDVQDPLPKWEGGDYLVINHTNTKKGDKDGNEAHGHASGEEPAPDAGRPDAES